jgi:hypothetical protein
VRQRGAEEVERNSVVIIVARQDLLKTSGYSRCPVVLANIVRHSEPERHACELRFATKAANKFTAQAFWQRKGICTSRGLSDAFGVFALLQARV